MNHCCIDNIPPFRPARGRSRRLRPAAIAALIISAAVVLGGDVPRAYQISWTQDDWSGHAYYWQNATDPEIHPGLLLPLNNPADPRFVAEPTSYRGLWALAAYHDTLILGAGPYPLNPDGADILTYDYLTGQFALSSQLPEEGVAVIKVRGDTLYIPGPDTHYSGSHGSSVYLYNGRQWTTKQSVIGAVHLFDVEVLNDAIYVSSGDGSGNASVYQSLDHGDSFTRIFSLDYTLEHRIRRMHALAVHQGRLYAQPDGWEPEDDMVFTFDGADWDTIQVVGLPQGTTTENYGWQGTFTTWGDSLILGIKDKLFIFANNQVYRSNLPFWCARMGSGFGAYKGALYSGGGSGYLYRWRPGQGWTQLAPLGPDPSTEPVQAFATYYGRLYIATSRTEGLTGGRLYVSACASVGRLISLPHDFGIPVYDVQIAWDHFSPDPAALVRFQVRSAPSEAQLPARPWTGPDGTSATWYTQPGAPLPALHDTDRYFQYLVELHSPDGLKMPLLRSVTLAADSTAGAAVDEPLPVEDPRAPRLRLEPPFPNPATASVLVRAHLGHVGRADGPLELRVLDVQGRQVRAVTLDPAGRRAADWLWDLSDDAGRRVPTGIYQIAARLPGQPGSPAAGRVLVLP